MKRRPLESFSIEYIKKESKGFLFSIKFIEKVIEEANKVNKIPKIIVEIHTKDKIFNIESIVKSKRK